MKSTILTSTPPTKGISKYSVALIEALAETGSIEVVSFKKMYPNALYPGGVDDDSLRLLRQSKYIKLRRFLTWYNPLGWMYAGLTIKGKILHIQWWTYVLAPVYIVVIIFAKLRGKKVLVTMHNVKPHESGVLKNIANKAIVSLGDEYIVHTGGGREDLAQVYGIAVDRIHVIPHGILMPDAPLRRISKKQARKKLEIAYDRKVILFFGIIRDYKGLDILLNSLAQIKARIPEAHLVIAGKPWGGWDKYDEIIEKNNLKDNVTLHPEFVAEDDIETYYAASDLVALPYRHFDAQSGAGTLGLPFGKAMIVTDTGGLPDLVKNKRAIVRAGDESELANAIEGILTNDKLRAELEEDSGDLASAYSWDTIAQQTIEVYKKLITKN